VCAELKKDINTRHIPVIFMTGLTESEHVVAGFSAGGTDYVTKPLNADEVIARLETHLSNARAMSQTKSALDSFGQAVIAVLPASYKVIWQTPLAKQLLNKYVPSNTPDEKHDLSALNEWIQSIASNGQSKVDPYSLNSETGQLLFTPIDTNSDEQWLIMLKEKSEAADIEALKNMFKLTKRESEVLYWAIMGKTNKHIAEILGCGPRTVNKHMEHVLIKLGVETRTAAASLAINKLHLTVR